MNEELKHLGDIRLTVLELLTSDGLSVNIISQFDTLSLVENLYTPWLSGDLTLIDAQQIDALLPLTGNEFINIEFHTPGLEGFKEQFFIYEISDRIQLKPNVKGYRLKFISKEALVSLNYPISKTFRGSAESMIDTILSEHLQSAHKLKFDNSTNTFAFISNYWTAHKCFNYILKHALDVNGFPVFTLYQNREGFNLRSLNELIDTELNPPKRIFKTRLNKPTDINGAINTVSEEDYSTILALNYTDETSIFDKIEHGYYGSTVTSFDTTTGNYSLISNGILSGYNTLNKHSTFTDGTVGSSLAKMHTVARAYNNLEDTHDNTNYKSLTERELFLQRLNNRILKIRVYGRTDYTVGETAVLMLPINTQTDSDTSNVDEFTSGNYLISSIRHVVTSDMTHWCNIELCNDSYTSELK